MWLKDIDNFPLLPNKLDGDESEYERGYHDATANLNALPTIDPESLRPTGEWINLTECANEGVYCSVCRKKVYKADYAWAVKKNKVRSNYCPNCGAKMKGEK